MRVTLPPKRWDWLAFIALLIVGMALMQLAAMWATRLPPNWQAQANMDSNIDPDRAYQLLPVFTAEPLRPEIITPPAWNTDELLNPESTSVQSGISSEITIVPQMVFEPMSTPTPAPELDQPSPQPTATSPQASATAIPPSPTVKPTRSPTFTATATPAQSATPTQSPSPTSTQTLSATPTQPPTATTVVKTRPPKPTKEPRPTSEPKPTKESKPSKDPKP